VPLSPLVASYDHVVCDMDGCLWIGDDVGWLAERPMKDWFIR